MLSLTIQENRMILNSLSDIKNNYVNHLSSDAVRCGPQCVVFLHDFRVLNDSFQFFEHTFVNICLDENAQIYISFETWTASNFLSVSHLFPDHRVILVVGVICVP